MLFTVEMFILPMVREAGARAQEALKEPAPEQRVERERRLQGVNSDAEE